MNKLSKRELATVLHALRHTQNIIKSMDISASPHFAAEGIQPLTGLEIDRLCEQLSAGGKTRLYRISVTRVRPNVNPVIELVVRAKNYVQAKKVATDVLEEMCLVGHGDLKGVIVRLTIDPLAEPENGGTGYCYPVAGKDRVYMHTFK